MTPLLFSDVLKEILTLTAYPKDIQQYVKKFLEFSAIEAFVELLEKLPPTTIEAIEEANQINDSDKLKQLLTPYFNEDLYKNAYREANSTAFSAFLNRLLPTLSPDHKTAVESYLRTIDIDTIIMNSVEELPTISQALLEDQEQLHEILQGE